MDTSCEEVMGRLIKQACNYWLMKYALFYCSLVDVIWQQASRCTPSLFHLTPWRSVITLKFRESFRRLMQWESLAGLHANNIYWHPHAKKRSTTYGITLLKILRPFILMAKNSVQLSYCRNKAKVWCDTTADSCVLLHAGLCLQFFDKAIEFLMYLKMYVLLVLAFFIEKSECVWM